MVRAWPPFACSFLPVFFSLIAFAATERQFHYTVDPHATVVIDNQTGSVAIEAASATQVNVTATLYSDRVEIDAQQRGNRVELYTRPVQANGRRESRVDYSIEVPADATVDIRDAGGPVELDGLHGSLSIEADTARVSARNIQDGRLQVRTLAGPVFLSNLHHEDVEIVSVSGDVSLDQTDGDSVSVNTTSGRIQCDGTFRGAGSYSLSTHSGDITVAVPAATPIDISARSVKGSVNSELPLQDNTQPTVPIETRRSYAGSSPPAADSAGATPPLAATPSLMLRSFSGKIRVAKR